MKPKWFGQQENETKKIREFLPNIQFSVLWGVFDGKGA